NAEFNQDTLNLYGGAGGDVLDGSSMSAEGIIMRFEAGAGGDTVRGGGGRDQLKGGDGNDVLDGGANGDYVYGDAGDDTIWFGKGNDMLWGGAGADLFVAAPGGTGASAISDFQHAGAEQDRIDVSMYSSSQGMNWLSAIATQHSNGLVLQLNSAQSVLLVGVTLADLDASNFVFA
ncbi:MAG TPA: hypothetical protein VIT92_00120, partial [Burkholderiaceae bacterium]